MRSRHLGAHELKYVISMKRNQGFELNFMHKFFFFFLFFLIVRKSIYRMGFHQNCASDDIHLIFFYGEKNQNIRV